MFWPKGKCLPYNLTNLPKLLVNIPSLFHNVSIWLGLHHPSIANVLWCVHTSHRPYGYPIITSCSWQWAHMNAWCHCVGCWLARVVKVITCVSFKHIQFIPSTSQHCAHQRLHLHLNQHCHYWPNISGFISLILRHLKIYCFWCCKPKNIAIALDILPINSSP